MTTAGTTLTIRAGPSMKETFFVPASHLDDHASIRELVMALSLSNLDATEPLNVYICFAGSRTETRLCPSLWPKLSTLGLAGTLVVDIPAYVPRAPKTMLALELCFRVREGARDLQALEHEPPLELAFEPPHTAARVFAQVLDYLGVRYREWLARKMVPAVGAVAFNKSHVCCTMGAWAEDEGAVAFVDTPGVVVSSGLLFCEIVTLPEVTWWACARAEE